MRPRDHDVCLIAVDAETRKNRRQRNRRGGRGNGEAGAVNIDGGIGPGVDNFEDQAGVGTGEFQRAGAFLIENGDGRTVGGDAIPSFNQIRCFAGDGERVGEDERRLGIDVGEVQDRIQDDGVQIDDDERDRSSEEFEIDEIAVVVGFEYVDGGGNERGKRGEVLPGKAVIDDGRLAGAIDLSYRGAHLREGDGERGVGGRGDIFPNPHGTGAINGVEIRHVGVRHRGAAKKQAGGNGCDRGACFHLDGGWGDGASPRGEEKFRSLFHYRKLPHVNFIREVRRRSGVSRRIRYVAPGVESASSPLIEF